MGWKNTGREVRYKGLERLCTPLPHAFGLDQLMAAMDHPIPLADSAKMKNIDSYPNMPYTVKL
jgi:hypothetical protein